MRTEVEAYIVKDNFEEELLIPFKTKIEIKNIVCNISKELLERSTNENISLSRLIQYTLDELKELVE